MSRIILLTLGAWVFIIGTIVACIQLFDVQPDLVQQCIRAFTENGYDIKIEEMQYCYSLGE